MSRFTNWGKHRSTFIVVAIIFGFFSFIPFFVIAAQLPFVAALVLFGLGIASIFAWWAVNRSDASSDEEEPIYKRDSLAVLKERYARSEISEEEFEHRVTMLLNVDEIAKSE